MPPPPELEPFLLLARSARGRAAAELVLKATSAPGVFVFGELLDEAHVREVRGVGGVGIRFLGLREARCLAPTDPPAPF